VCTLRRAFSLRAFAVGAGLARCWLPSHPGEVAMPAAIGAASTAVDSNKPCSSNTSPWSGCARLCSSRCTLACSLQPHYTPVPSPVADDTCMRTGQGPFQGRPDRIAARASTSSTSSWPSSPSRTARRGAEGTEAGNFRGGPIKGHLSGLSGLSKKKEIKGTVASEAIRSKM
jgi:hypothetical protein